MGLCEEILLINFYILNILLDENLWLANEIHEN